jgi:hypothetical protein
VPPKLDIQQVKAILNASDLIASWQVLIEDETADRGLYKIRCRALRTAYELELRFIQTENEIIYSYQLHGQAYHAMGQCPTFSSLTKLSPSHPR